MSMDLPMPNIIEKDPNEPNYIVQPSDEVMLNRVLYIMDRNRQLQRLPDDEQIYTTIKVGKQNA